MEVLNWMQEHPFASMLFGVALLALLGAAFYARCNGDNDG